jgi:hypothetical protein
VGKAKDCTDWIWSIMARDKRNIPKGLIEIYSRFMVWICTCNNGRRRAHFNLLTEKWAIPHPSRSIEMAAL